VTVTRVQLTRDLASAKLYVSVLGDERDRDRVMKALEGATGYAGGAGNSIPGHGEDYYYVGCLAY